MLSNDICRCINLKCELPCRRKERGGEPFQPYNMFRYGKVKRCEYQIKPINNKQL